MTKRRSAAPDIAGCVLLLYAATLSFAFLHGFYSSSSLAGVVPQVAVYGGLLAACGVSALGLFDRKAWARGMGLLLFVAAFIAGVTEFHVPDTAQLPTAMLSLFAIVLLLATGGEFAPGGAADRDPVDSPPGERDND